MEETWWWDIKVDEAVKEKLRCFKVWSRLKKQKVCGNARKATRAAYDTAKKHAKWVVWLDLEKAFDRVPRKVLWWAMRKVGVEEWIVRLVQAMYAAK